MKFAQFWRCVASLYVPLGLACSPSATQEVVRVPAQQSDVSSIDAIMRAFYEVVNVEPNALRQWSRDRTLYTPDIRFIGLGKHIDIYDHQALVDATEPLVKQGFQEREIFRVVRRYGNLAQVLSSYETRLGAPPGQMQRGVNSLQLYFDGTRWWIASVVWQTENPQLPIPAELLGPTPTQH